MGWVGGWAPRPRCANICHLLPAKDDGQEERRDRGPEEAPTGQGLLCVAAEIKPQRPRDFPSRVGPGAGPLCSAGVGEQGLEGLGSYGVGPTLGAGLDGRPSPASPAVQSLEVPSGTEIPSSLQPIRMASPGKSP